MSILAAALHSLQGPHGVIIQLLTLNEIGCQLTFFIDWLHPSYYVGTISYLETAYLDNKIGRAKRAGKAYGEFLGEPVCSISFCLLLFRTLVVYLLHKRQEKNVCVEHWEHTTRERFFQSNVSLHWCYSPSSLLLLFFCSNFLRVREKMLSTGNPSIW